MLTLNLLPERYKVEYLFEKKKRFLVFFGISLCLILSVLCALLFSTYLFLVISQKSLAATLEARRQAEVSTRLEAIKEEIQGLNTKIGTVKSAKKGVVFFGPTLEKIIVLVEPGVYLKNISFDAKTKIVNVLGFADTREKVLLLSVALSAGDFVLPNSLISPIANILKEKDIDFSFTFNLK
ncbi:hypothetical protein HY250_00775 [Candidatus Azambacteria bacterium]|nr:hypothetical protein [Candidatus Azambacteria bacterium]MBI3684929.1 hypothetical protein [Candidatus Azambacteria bacterium]